MPLETIRGRVEPMKGMGYWVLRATDNHSYAIGGGDKALRQPGLEVEITGEIRRSSIGLSQSSGMITVKSYRVLSQPAKGS